MKKTIKKDKQVSHTPGPWMVPHFATNHGCKCTVILDANCYMGGICNIFIDNGKRVSEGGNDAPPLEEAKFNAYLIASAPELLEVLESFPGHSSETEWNKWMAKRDTVIAKARGKIIL